MGNAVPPGLCDVLKLAGAVDPLHITNADLGSTNCHEIRSGATNGELGKVGQ